MDEIIHMENYTQKIENPLTFRLAHAFFGTRFQDRSTSESKHEELGAGLNKICQKIYKIGSVT